MTSGSSSRCPGSRPAGAVVLAVLVLVVGVALAATGDAAAGPVAGAQDQQATPRPPTFGTTVSRVLVDVIVTDARGRFVGDLEPGDFRLLEDGREVEILDVQVVDLEAGDVTYLGSGPPVSGAARAGDVDAADTADGAAVVDAWGGARGRDRRASGGDALPPNPEAAGAGAARGAAAAAPGRSVDDLGAMVFLIDGPSLTAETKARFADAWNDLLDRTADLPVPRSVYLVDNVGGLREIAPMTREIDALRAVAGEVTELPLTTTRRTEAMIELQQDLTSPDPALADAALAKARSLEFEERSRSLASYELLTSFCDALWTRSGRTALVWVSSGVKVMTGGPFMAMIAASQGDALDAEGAPGTRSSRWDLFAPDAAIRREQERLHRAANSSNVSIYTVDPTPLAASRLLASDARIAQGGTASLVSSPLIQGSLEGLRDSLRNASEATGGRSFLGDTDLEAALEEITGDSSRFYLLTYAPPPPDGDGEYHEIRVEIDRDDVRVRARGGYVDHPGSERMRRLVGAALQLPGSISDLPVTVETYTSWATGDAAVMVAVAVDASEVGVTVDAAGDLGASLDVHATVLAGDELAAEIHEGLYAHRSPPQADAGEPGSGSARFTPVGFLVYRHEMALEPGDYELRVAVVDNFTGRIGARRVELPVPEPPAGWSAGQPIVVAREPGGGVQPVVGGKALSGQPLHVFVEVYGGQRPILSGLVLAADGSDAGDEGGGARLFPLPMTRVAARVHRGSVQLPPELPPGDYVLQVTVTDPVAGEHAIRRVDLQVVAPDR